MFPHRDLQQSLQPVARNATHRVKVRASDGAHHVGKRAAGSRFKLTGLRIGSEAATKESGPRETPAALKTLQQDLLGCDNQTRAFLAGV